MPCGYQCLSIDAVPSIKTWLRREWVLIIRSVRVVIGRNVSLPIIPRAPNLLVTSLPSAKNTQIATWHESGISTHDFKLTIYLGLPY